jgi:hypothetical protein
MASSPLPDPAATPARVSCAEPFGGVHFLGKATGVKARTVIAIVAAAWFAACAEGTTPPEPPASDAIAGLQPSAPVEIGLGDVAADADDVAALTALLEGAGFETAIERSYAGGAGAIRHVDVRVVRFATPDGADRYRSWLEAHASDVIDAAEPASALAPPSTAVFVHEPDACCPRETAVALAVWRRGRDVLRVVIAGPEADGQRTLTIVTALSSPAP